MAITIDWANKLVLSTASINDIVAHHDTLRDYEDSDEGMLHDPIISYKVLDLGGGAYFYGLDYINGYQLKFPSAGNYTVIGNINATIVPVAGVYVDRTKAAAFATVAGSGASGPSAADVAAAVRTELAAELARILDLAKINGLVAGTNAVVTATGRTAGDIVQTISEAAGTVTVSRA
jgi:hypothetical protein